MNCQLIINKNKQLMSWGWASRDNNARPGPSWRVNVHLPDAGGGGNVAPICLYNPHKSPLYWFLIQAYHFEGSDEDIMRPPVTTPRPPALIRS